MPLSLSPNCSILDVAAVLNPPWNRYSVLHNILKKQFMVAYLYSVLLLLLILIPFTDSL